MSGFNWVCPTCGTATHSKEALVRTSEKSCSCDSALWEASDMPPCVAKLQEEIAALETSLAERWENLNVQDGVIDGLREEIAEQKRMLDGYRVASMANSIMDTKHRERIAALEKVLATAKPVYRKTSDSMVKSGHALSGELLYYRLEPYEVAAVGGLLGEKSK